MKEDCVYPFGIDPKWYLASNTLSYVNSMKMKLSVILGVSQMIIGIFMKGLNSIHFRRSIDFFFEFIPQLILMCCLFGYMDYLIITKWVMNWDGITDKAPGIISTMIGMFLKFGEIPEHSNPLIVNAEYQQKLSMTLLLVGLVCVPLMLFVKPMYHLYSHSSDGQHSAKGEHVLLPDNDDNLVEMADIDDPEAKHMEVEEGKSKECNKLEMSQMDLLDYVEGGTEESHEFAEIFIHQLIETIEFVLGTVSNTASYLRLWALSLAHSQLAAVFYEKLIGGMAFEVNEGKGSPLLLFLVFPAFFSFTLFVLMCMDSMECFLHCLRLHWVEFQNKFYKGNGYRFTPFSYENTLTAHNEASLG